MSTFTKTRKGLEEIESRSGGLHPRVRRLLILVDGRRATHELATVVNDPHFEQTLATLQEGGYIEAEASPEPAPAPAPAAVIAPPTSAANGGGQLEVARNFMMNTLKTFNGPYGKLSLVQKIHDSTTCEQLQALFEEWLHAIGETRAGRQRAEELSARLKALL